MKEKISLSGCSTYEPKAVRAALIEGLEPFGGMDLIVRSGDSILIKPNMLSPKKPDEGITTHPAIVAAVIELILDCGGKPFVGDSPGIGSLEKVARRAGILDVCRRYGVELIDLDASGSTAAGNGTIFKNLKVSQIAREADTIINLPKIKTHAQMVLTMGIKNLFGCVLGREKARWHFNAGNNRLYFARLLIEIYKTLKPVFTISDCIVAMEGNGPSAGTLRTIGLIGCARDAVAHDAVFSTILGLAPQNLPVVRAAQEIHLGNPNINEIEVISKKSLSELVLDDFEFPPTVDVMFGLPGPIQRFVRNSISSKPVIDHGTCTRCMKCVDACPPGVMSKIDARIEIDYGRCISCFCCQELCPEGSITPKEGWLSRFML